MNITAVRHGQTEGNVLHLIQSRTDGALTDLGIKQAQATALKLQHLNFDAIYCSDLGRCKQTLSHIIQYHQAIPVHYTPNLRELNKGTLEGKTWEDLPDDFYSGAYIGVRIGGGESWGDVDHRLRTFLNDVYDSGAKEVLVITHEGPLKVLHSILTDTTLADAVPIKYDNAGVYTWTMLGKCRTVSVQ